MGFRDLWRHRSIKPEPVTLPATPDEPMRWSNTDDPFQWAVNAASEAIVWNRDPITAIAVAQQDFHHYHPQPDRVVDVLTIADVRAVDGLLRFHETGGHEGSGSDADLDAVRTVVSKLLTTLDAKDQSRA